MKIVNGYDLIKYAQKKKLLLPAFNTTNMEMTYAIAKGLDRAGLPGYIQISSNNLRLSNPQMIVELTRDALRNVEVPIALHLDHGTSFEDVKACVDAGFTSIMIDASKYPFEENVKIVSQAVEYCHFYGVPVEAEIGALQGKEDDNVNEADCKTDPEEARAFAEATGCDTLAVSVGNVHGLDIEPRIDLPLLKKISEVVSVPLVLHGGSGVPFEVIRQAKQYHLIKVNYGADLRKAYISTFGEAYESNHNAHDVISLSMQSVVNVSDRANYLVQTINQ